VGPSWATHQSVTRRLASAALIRSTARSRGEDGAPAPPAAAVAAPVLRPLRVSVAAAQAVA